MSSINNDLEQPISSEATLEKLLTNKNANLFILFTFILISVLLYYRDGYFFFWDEWDLLYGLSTNNIFDWSIIPHNEHLKPFFKLTWGLLINIFKENYGYIVLINCVLIGINSFLMLIFLQKFGINKKSSLILSLFYLIGLPAFSLACPSFMSCISLSVMLLILSIIFLINYLEKHNFRWLLLSSLFIFVSSGFYNLTMLMPLFLLTLAILYSKTNLNKTQLIQTFLTYGMTLFIIVGLYLIIASNAISVHRNVLDIKWDSFIKFWIKFMFGTPFYYFIPVELLKEWFPIINTEHVRTIIIPTIFCILTCYILLSIFRKSIGNGKRTLALGIIFLFICSILITISRHRFGSNVAFSPRYHPYILISSSLILGLWFKYNWQKYKYDRLNKVVIVMIICILLAGNITSIFNQQSEILKRDKKTIDRYSEIKSNKDIEESTIFNPDSHPEITIDKVRKIILYLNS